ncbi:M14 family zinc carboxypeptidase [Candidatus Latescibacterota bacterium]
MQRRQFLVVAAIIMMFALVNSCSAPESSDEVELVPPVEGFHFIDTSFENASPLDWEIDEDRTIHIRLLSDHERSTPNRQGGHWHFKLEADPGSQWIIILSDGFDTIWNRQRITPLSDETTFCASPDGKEWTVHQTEMIEGNRLKLQVTVETGELYIARITPYSLSHLQSLKERIGGHDFVEITDIGRTVQGRALEMIRVGDPDAPHSLVIRARAHPWEPGGNWVMDGLLDRLCGDDADAQKWRKQFCVYVMPMANKDGVVAGMTRFNMRGKDLNREWDQPADQVLAPEKHALEQWLDAMVQKERRPDIYIDFHNDNNGNVSFRPPPQVTPDTNRHRPQHFEAVLRAHTWFTEVCRTSEPPKPGEPGGGLSARYGFMAITHELNSNYIAGLDQPASATHWKTYGASLPNVFAEYFNKENAE